MMAGVSADPVNTCSIAFADPAFDESRMRAAGRDALPHAAFRRSRRERRFRPHRHACATLRRALRGQLGDSDLPRLPARAQARDRRAVGRRRRRELRRLPALPAARGGGAAALRAAAVRPPAAVRPARPRVSEGRLGAARVARQVDVRGARAQFGRSLLPRRFHLARRHAPRSSSATRSGAARRLQRGRGVPPPCARARAPTTRWP